VAPPVAGAIRQRAGGVGAAGANATHTGRGTVIVAPLGESVPVDVSTANVTIEFER
jgi:hypothetical protein